MTAMQSEHAFERLVEEVAQVGGAVGKGRAVVQDVLARRPVHA